MLGGTSLFYKKRIMFHLASNACIISTKFQRTLSVVDMRTKNYSNCLSPFLEVLR
ncbi:UNVERIFIED_CONTAM: hypothetical protein GTU68_029418 [Idotea baltica]|nr:hypothetical protein [Idotea baltica]